MPTSAQIARVSVCDATSIRSRSRSSDIGRRVAGQRDEHRHDDRRASTAPKSPPTWNDDRERAEQMGGAEQQRNMVERGDALFGDGRFVFILGLADVEEQRLGKADARPCCRAGEPLRQIGLDALH